VFQGDQAAAGGVQGEVEEKGTPLAAAELQQQEQEQTCLPVAKTDPSGTEGQQRQHQETGPAGQSNGQSSGQTLSRTGQNTHSGSYTDMQGPSHEPEHLVEQQWQPLDCVLQLVKQSTMMLTTGVDLRALAIAVYSKVSAGKWQYSSSR
jgi:hypothetical protein